MIQCVGGWKEDRKYRKLANETIMEAMQENTETPSEFKYDISSIFQKTVTKTLLNVYEELKRNVAYQCHTEKNFSDSFTIELGEKVHEMHVRNAMFSFVFPIAREEVCNSNYSQVSK